MKLAPLQLDDYFITALTLNANPSFQPDQPVDDCIDVLHVSPTIERSRDLGEKGTEWDVVLNIVQETPEGRNLPYSFALRIQGTVVASPHLSGTVLQRAVHANGPAMLFGAAREIIRAATGRGPWPAVIIPSTNFFAGLPPLNPTVEPPAQPTPAEKKKPVAKATRRKKQT